MVKQSRQGFTFYSKGLMKLRCFHFRVSAFGRCHSSLSPEDLQDRPTLSAANMADLVIIDIEESDDDVFFLGDPYEGDTFQNSGSSYFRFICSRESRYVVLEMDGNLYGKDLNVRETNRGCKFNIQLYDSTKCNARTTKAIMLCMNTEKDSKCVCVSEDGSNLRFTKQPSSPLPGDSHESIFFLKKLPNSNRYTMESSKIPSSFISFEPVVGRKDMVKVVLRHKDKKEMDETCEISFKPVDPIF